MLHLLGQVAKHKEVHRLGAPRGRAEQDAPSPWVSRKGVHRLAAPYSLRRYLRVKKWHDGYLEVEADYGDGAEEDYIDLRPVLRNLMIDPKKFLKPVKRVEVSYA